MSKSLQKNGFILSALCLGLMLGTVSGQAKEFELANSVQSQIQSVKYLSWPKVEGEPQPLMMMIRGTSHVFRLERPIIRAAVSDPTVCDILTLNPQEILIHARGVGRMNLILWDEDNRIATYDLQSIVDVERLEVMLKSIAPQSDLHVMPFNESVIVYGTTQNSSRVQQVTEAVTAFDEKAKSFVDIAEPKQVLLEVRFAEVSRKTNENFGLDFELVSHLWQTRSFSGRNAPSGTTDSTYQTDQGAVAVEPIGLPTSAGSTDQFLSYVSGSTLASAYLQWLEQKNILKIIARPNLLAKDGEEAKFIVGGEFPIPITTDNNIEIEYKEFGTKLNFTPVVLDNDVLRLKVDTEISELDFSNTVSFGATTVPSILKRNQQTVAELKEGQSLIIGGMITQRINRVKKKVPLFGDIPIVKNYFKRDEFSRTDVELLVVITPHLVRPFDLQENKRYGDPETHPAIKKSIQLYQPAYPDAQGDAVNQLFVQGEDYGHFEEELAAAENIAEEIEAEKTMTKDTAIEISARDLMAQPEPETVQF